MARLVNSLVLTACVLTACVLTFGCNAGEGSSDGMAWLLVVCQPREKATPEQIQRLEDAIRALPSRVTGIERFEWGRIESGHSSDTHCLLVTVKALGGASEVYRRVQQLRDEFAEGYRVTPCEFVVHDATPDARTATRSHLRRVVSFRLMTERVEPEEIQKVEDAMSALPSKISAIEQLQWGKQSFLDPSGKSPRHCLLLTFKDASARDKCLADQAYKKFEELLKQHVGEPSEWEYIARGTRD